MKLTNLRKKDFDEILINYNIGKYKKSKHIDFALGNTVYILETTKGKYVLKIFERAKLEYINYQIKTMNFLYKKKVSVPSLIKTKNKQFLLIHNGKKILVQKFVEGKIPKKLTESLLKDMGKKIGQMDKNLLRLKLTERFVWEKDHEFKHAEYRVGKIENFDFNEEEKKLLAELEKINRKKLRKSVVHGDCHSVNLLVKGERITAIIDWDDVHEDYLIYELSAFIAHTFFITPLYYRTGNFNKEHLRLFLREYQKHIKLNDEEKKAIYFFIKQRFLIVIGWSSDQMKFHKDWIEKLKNDQIRRIKQYNFFKKMPLQEFMQLFKR